MFAKSGLDPNDAISMAAKRAKSTFPFGKCKVCNDKATGVHYGIATCEGCKVSTTNANAKKYILHLIEFINFKGIL